jgi:hypothetical protein
MGRDNAMHHGKSHPSTFSKGFRGEERLKDAVRGVGGVIVWFEEMRRIIFGAEGGT